MPAPDSFDYAVIRVVPRVERGELINAGIVLFCLGRDYLAARVEVNEPRLRALWPEIDVDLVRKHLDSIPRICAGTPDSGPIGRLSLRERFHWLVAPRSTIIQVSPAHTGLCGHHPEASLEKLFREMVQLP